MPRLASLFLACLALAPASGRAELYLWVDAEGRTIVTDDLAGVPESERERVVSQGDELRALWSDGLLDLLRASPRGPSSLAEARVARLLRGALDDLRRGETARATASLEGILRLEPGRPEPHFFLALLDRQRGRFDSAEAHLRAFLLGAGDELEPWRASAERRLRGLEAERRLAQSQLEKGPLRFLALSTPHFRVQLDAALAGASPGYAHRVVRYLEEAHRGVEGRLGVAPREPTGVVLYGKAAYLRAHRHRFSFETVGFFDGRIHVVSAAQPVGELRALLFHEYTHAIFRERTGGDRPFWLNEGMAELSERTAQGRPPLTRGERSRLRGAIEGDRWLPLRRLAPSFGGLSEAEAPLAYLEATAAAAWIERRTDREARARLLERLAAGVGADRALQEVVGLDTDGLEEAVRREVLADFPPARP